MNKVQLRVYAAKERGCLVSNLEGLDAKPMIRRFVGWQFDPSLGLVGGWTPKKEAEVLNVSKLDNLQSYIKSLQTGDLLPADKDTATLAGLKFTETKKE